MIKNLLKLTSELLEAKESTEDYHLKDRKLSQDIVKFIKTLKTPKYYKGVQLPHFAVEMPRLEGNKSIYEGSSRWFMQMPFEHAVRVILRLMAVYPKGKKFLDVGSGTGNMVALANEMGLEGYGIEGSKVLPGLIPQLKDLSIYNQDFFTFDKYGEFDLIYAWNPNPPRMKELGKLITSQIKNKCVIHGLASPAYGNPDGALDGGSYLDSTWKIKKALLIKKA